MDDEPPRKRAKTNEVSDSSGNDTRLRLSKERMFIGVENLFKKDVLKESKESEAILCCDEEMRAKLMDIAERIIKLPKYRSVKLHDVYMALIFTFYSLLGEQTEDVFDTEFFYGKAFNALDPHNIFLDLTTGDIEEADGTNLSQVVRRMLLGLNGGKRRKRTLRSRRRTKTRRTKTRRRKTMRRKK